jgi:leader peptidase (prepilin peptidase)/N-methyltransferase
LFSSAKPEFGAAGANGVMSVVFLVALIGACLGSFANVAALRSLDGRDWVRAPSACFHCHQKLRFWQNLPIVGYLSHGGKTACCQQRLPARYIFVELAMAALLVLAWQQLPSFAFFGFVPFLVLMVVIFLTDMDDFIIPDWTSLGGLGLGLLLALLNVPGLPDIKTAGLGGAAGFGLIYGINFIYKLWRGHDGMGFGDVKLMAMLGVWLGPVSLLPILFSASLSGAVIGIGAIVFHRLQNSEAAPAQLPFGCFLTPMAVLWLLFAPQALQTLL